MSHCSYDPIVCPPMQFINHQFVPQVVPVVHPIEIVNQTHIVPIPHHVFPVSVKDPGDPCCHTLGHGKRRGSSKR
ncbi:hypothetical protein P4H71_22240 [Paenibacillus kribbensis]|uniref:Spore coat protein D n=1 Tax=Paenibacillus kribbensis TaxID=172713 RepID=A0A222WKT8_9BACL|nr:MULTISPECIES: hypothetical protein [Paenibacillus]ASR46726.1 hypothetical protein B4V02_08565 [Paenibacillus kribbensis]EHS56966.1 hypothetical protein WG8_3236 [Paenibacillus sp. Aloe-11]MEC0237046.1 hypothetical protein [Paenibacillus kribbensis]